MGCETPKEQCVGTGFILVIKSYPLMSLGEQVYFVRRLTLKKGPNYGGQ